MPVLFRRRYLPKRTGSKMTSSHAFQAFFIISGLLFCLLGPTNALAGC